MNCKLCQKESDSYLAGRLSDDMRTQIEEHLLKCADCANIYRMLTLADRVMNLEKTTSPEVYLASRIMARIEIPDITGYKTINPFVRVLKPVLIMTSMAAAIFAGVLIGNTYKPYVGEHPRPVELALIDDVAIESVDILSNE
jgi:predicted anti-sigma-YlaC factor YlaD